MLKIIFYTLSSLLFLIFSKKKKLFPNYYGEKHQLFFKKNDIPLIGGILFLFPCFYLFININFIVIVFLFLIFLVGFLSDLKILISPKKRFLLQVMIIFFSVLFLEIYISETRISLLDKLFDNKIFSIFFSIFCIMILINGSNFIDGLNSLLLGYFIIVLVIIFRLNFFDNLNVSDQNLIFPLYCLILLIFLNFLNLLYLGDGGSYLIGFSLAYVLISSFNVSNNISPFFIILMLWYPCFENLFSILRKLKLKKSPFLPDNKHFHQLFYFFLNKKFIKNSLLSNNVTSIIINSYNLIVMIAASTNISNTKFQIFLIMINIVIYLIFYLLFFNFRFNKK